MKRSLLAGAVVLSVAAGCSGLAQDINKGAGTTEHEFNHGTRNDTHHELGVRDAGPPDGAPASGDSGSISL
jgi:hypothetical protein